MRQYDARYRSVITRKLVILHCDHSLELVVRSDTDLGYCLAKAYDAQSCKQHHLFDIGINIDYWLARSPVELYRILQLIKSG